MAKSSRRWGIVDLEEIKRERRTQDWCWGLQTFLHLMFSYLWPLCTALFALWLAWRVGFLPPLLGFGLALAAIGIAIFGGYAAVRAVFGGTTVDLDQDDPTRIGRLLNHLWGVLLLLCLYGTTTTCTSACGLAVWNWGRNLFR